MDGQPKVMTVRGPIPASQCGFTLTHEHPFCILRQARHRYDFPDQIDDEDLVATEVGAFVLQDGELLGRDRADGMERAEGEAAGTLRARGCPEHALLDR